VSRIEIFHWPTDYPELTPPEGTVMPYEEGWYYWYCQLGCLPDSDPIGPLEIRIEVEQDELDVRGNALVSGDDATDRECEDEIIARLNRGDVWAWAHVRVVVTDGEYEGSDSLGTCSYEDERDFRKCGYYSDMVQNALDEFKRQVESA